MAALAFLGMGGSVLFAWLSCRLYNRGAFTWHLDISALCLFFFGSLALFRYLGWL